MTGPGPIDGPRAGPFSGGAPRQLVILLHGYGADGDDLIALAPHWGAFLPDAAFVAPHAPESCALSPMGRQWFGLEDYDPLMMAHDPDYRRRMGKRMAEGAQAAAPLLGAFIEAERSRAGLDASALALVGFSQGTMMMFQVGLRLERAPAALVGFSGALVGGEELDAQALCCPPILLVHGDADEVVPLPAMFDALAALGKAGLTAEFHVSRGVGHGIAPDGLEIAGRFLARAFASS